MSRAPAVNVTGELTVAPLAGEQIFTVLSTVAVQAAHARLVEQRVSAKNSIAVERVRENIMGPT